ncbi:VOC family protein [Aureimonas glaciei]|uniref:Diguanylate cyclase n=1 Tax=Aureimonas glaciei TaxID=1776957 RepID=A0A917DCF1_9HYPH|nr:VOC family protein [Aureimonas glaciei]GGD26392.1 diguanylate cyclase [Aureimonas glaciei]
MGGRGLHHVTLIASDVDRSHRFYGAVLGLRLVKRTVSHEDPGTYHLFFGDETGGPGTLLTLFPWQGVARGHRGACEAWRTSLRVPAGSLDWWSRRLGAAGVDARGVTLAFGETALVFEDPDGALLSLAEGPGQTDGSVWRHPQIANGAAIIGLHDLVLKVRQADPIGELFREVLGFREVAREGLAVRLVAHDGPGGMITLDETGQVPMGRLGAGSVHHAAFRALDSADEDRMAAELLTRYAIRTTVPKDRTYFRSVNFRSTCGLLMEIATDEPGLIVDETLGGLGTSLVLPSFLEARRVELECLLPRLRNMQDLGGDRAGPHAGTDVSL